MLKLYFASPQRTNQLLTVVTTLFIHHLHPMLSEVVDIDHRCMYAARQGSSVRLVISKIYLSDLHNLWIDIFRIFLGQNFYSLCPCINNLLITIPLQDYNSRPLEIGIDGSQSSKAKPSAPTLGTSSIQANQMNVQFHQNQKHQSFTRWKIWTKPTEQLDPGSSGGRMQSKHLTLEILGSRFSRQSAWLWFSLRSGVHYKTVLYCDQWDDSSTIILASFDLTQMRQFEQAIAVSMFNIIN